jgi:phosphoglycolate phosphatase
MMAIVERYETFLFDLDGTLTDPKEGITRSVQYALNRMAVQEEDLEGLVRFIGPPLKESFERYYGFSAAEAVQAIGYYREYFQARGIFENFVLEGMDRILTRLMEKGKGLFVATSKPTVFARKIADRFGLSPYFTEIVGSELDGRRCEKADVIRHILDHHGIRKEKTLMIGDREHDIRGALKNGMDSLGVGFGYGSQEELEGAGADYYVETIGALERLLFG